MQLSRRLILKGSLAVAALAAMPRALLAAVWPENAFSKTTSADAIADLFGTDQIAASDQISMKVPQIAENGAVVPVAIKTTLENVESISIVVEKNPRPLAATFELPAGTLPEVASRIKMGQTSDVLAIVMTDSGLFSTAKNVKVTICGCGG
jgi:sulfur-oxidizing protein SoxY